MNGCWSSSSSRFLACIGPELGQAGLDRVDRRAAGQAHDDQEDGAGRDAGDEDGKDGIWLDLDVDDLADDMNPMNIMNPPKRRMTTPAGRPRTAGGFANIGSMKPGAAMNRKPARPIGRTADDVAGQPLLRGQGPDLALDPDALADRVGDRVEDLGEVAADLVLDRDGGGHQLEVVRAHAADHVLERLVERQAEVDLADDPAELGRDRRPRLAHDELDGLEERRAGAQGVGDQGDRVRQLLVERVRAGRPCGGPARTAGAGSRRAPPISRNERVAERRQERATGGT